MIPNVKQKQLASSYSIALVELPFTFSNNSGLTERQNVL